MSTKRRCPRCVQYMPFGVTTCPGCAHDWRLERFNAPVDFYSKEEWVRYEKALLFCEANGVERVKPKKAWFEELPTHEQLEALRRFEIPVEEDFLRGRGQYTRGVSQNLLNACIDATKAKRPPRDWGTDEEIAAKAMQNTNIEYTKAVARSDGLRRECLILLGGVCMYPGCEEADPRVLEFDHKNDDGAEARRLGFVGEALYRDVLVRGAAGYQILCVKHNKLKYRELRERVKAAKDEK